MSVISYSDPCRTKVHSQLASSVLMTMFGYVCHFYLRYPEIQVYHGIQTRNPKHWHKHSQVPPDLAGHYSLIRAL